MVLAATLLTAAVALLHVYFLVLEMFLWESPAGRRAFGLSAEMAKATRMLAANQGLYNGFLAAGLGWVGRQDPSGYRPHPRHLLHSRRFFFRHCALPLQPAC